MPRSRMRGAISPLPNTSSWRGVQLSTGGNFNFTFIILVRITLACVCVYGSFNVA